MKIMLVGTTGAGKTTLIQALREEAIKWKKTQMVTYQDEFIDLPGEYLDIPRFHRVIIVTAMDASLIILVQPANSQQQNIPPGFASLFNQPVIGVITKVDLPGADVEKAKNLLQLAGANREIILLSAVTGEGLNQLIETLKKHGWQRINLEKEGGEKG